MATVLEISEVLGYHEVIETEFPISTTRMARIDSLLTALSVVDTSLNSVMTDGMAERVGDLQLNYSKYLAMLRNEGSRILREIASLSGIPLRYDRFLQGSSIRTISFHNDYG